MGRGGDKFLPFPTYYTNNPDHVLGARTRSRDRWLAAPKYKLLNLDDRDGAIKKYDKVGFLFSVVLHVKYDGNYGFFFHEMVQCINWFGI